jgi:hypothetical protein
MAVKVDTGRRPKGVGRLHGDMQDLGFLWHEKFQLWVVDRTDEDGNPFRTDGPTDDD